MLCILLLFLVDLFHSPILNCMVDVDVRCKTLWFRYILPFCCCYCCASITIIINTINIWNIDQKLIFPFLARANWSVFFFIRFILVFVVCANGRACIAHYFNSIDVQRCVLFIFFSLRSNWFRSIAACCTCTKFNFFFLCMILKIINFSRQSSISIDLFISSQYNQNRNNKNQIKKKTLFVWWFDDDGSFDMRISPVFFF